MNLRGKYYLECCAKELLAQNLACIGLVNVLEDLTNGGRDSRMDLTGVSYSESGELQTAGNRASFGDAWEAGDIIQMAVDATNINSIKVWFGNNNVWQNSGDPAAGGGIAATITNGEQIMAMSAGYSGTGELVFNFGQEGTFAGEKTAGGNADANGYGNFIYAPPTNFLALCTGNLTVADEIDPAQTDVNFPKKLFSAHLYAGAQVTNAVSGLGFQPDFINIKSRTAGTTNPLYDSSRGNTKLLSTVSTDGDTTQATTPGLSAFGTDGFTVVYPNTGDYYNNRNSNNYVAWCQRANGGTVSTNDEGSIDSSVQVDPSGCFSIATWTGTGSNATIGHGLGAKPSYILVKNRAEHAWAVYYGDNTDYLVLNTTAATVDDATYWQDTAPTTDVFSIGTEDGVNASSNTYIAYCYANCEGFIKSGTYEGNGNADGTFVYTGFSPAFIMTKSLDSTSNWQMFDNKRLGYNVDNNAASANLTDAPVTTDMIDILSNGFKCRIASDPNVAETYIYLAIAENPLKYATAR